MKLHALKYLEEFKEVAHLEILLDPKKNEILLLPGFRDDINLNYKKDIYRNNENSTCHQTHPELNKGEVKKKNQTL